MTQQNPLRLQQRAPVFNRTLGDRMRQGFERAMIDAQRSAAREGVRYVVTSARYHGGFYRVQAWR